MTHTQSSATQGPMSAADLANEITKPYGYYTCDFEMARQDAIGLINQYSAQVREQAIDDAIEDLSQQRSYAGAQNDRTYCRYLNLAIDALQTQKQGGASDDV